MENFINANHNVTDIVLACHVAPNKGDMVHKNRTSHGLAFNYDGEKIYAFSDGKKYTVKERCFIYLPKNSTYTVTPITPGTTYCINFQLGQTSPFSPFVFQLKNADEAIQAFKNAEKAWTQKKDGFSFLCKSELYKIFYVLQKNYVIPYSPNSKRSLIEPAVAYIHKHFVDDTINIYELSKLCGFSYEYFRRLFHACYGCSPVKYVLNLKLKHVKELLASGLYSVSEAALQAGFSDLSYFSRFFKKSVGISPNKYLTQTLTT